MPYSELANASATRSVLESFGLATKKRLGQNFLVSDWAIGKILDLAQLSEKDTVLEVGPGIGTLTVAMLPRVSALVAIEADHELPEVLALTCGKWNDKLALIEADAMRVGVTEIECALAALTGASSLPTTLVSNLPYQVAATLILRFLNELPSLERAVVMVQAEVADRICAQPKTKAYGAYTAKLALVAKVRGRFEVAPSNFLPAPHVNSSVIRLEREVACNPATGEELSGEELFQVRRVIDAAFATRRKTLRNSLSSHGFDVAAVDAAATATGIDVGRRAETLTRDEFICLASALPRKDS